MRYASCLIICLAVISFCANVGAVTPVQDTRVNAAPKTTKASRAPKAGDRQTAKFIAWKGNRLSTTAGTFLIGRNVKVIDRAKSREMKKGFSGPPPTVKLFYKDRRLVKVIIR